MLTDDDRALLDLESKWWRYPGRKEKAIRDELEITGTQYYQRLVALVERPEAIAYAPTTCARVRRQILAGQRAKDPRRLGLA